ncbi:MAG TPA: cupredoxin domain-containing protein [Candidatus Saccharimonadales bacterium]|jgi:cytochrome c oxidase subunit 2|nr:cupredoxin domain-containing protein [Candidatus Saccharimonadales bacterium]
MGKLFAIVVVIIALVSAGFIVAHVWWLPTPISTIAPGIDGQFNETMWFTGALFLSSQFVLAFFVWTSREGKDRKSKYWPGGPWPLVGFAIVVVGMEILTLTFVGSKVWAAVYMTPPDPDSMQVDVAAEQFAFNFRYPGPDGKFGTIHPEKIRDGNGNFFGLDPENDVAARDDVIVGTLTVPVNKPVSLTLHSKDMIHSFYVPELRIQQDIVPGLNVPLHFTATKVGSYEIVCTQLCGLGHYSMRSFLQVLPQDQFDQWLKTQ